MFRILLVPVFIALFLHNQVIRTMGQPVQGVPPVQKPSSRVKKGHVISDRATVARFFTTWLREKNITAALRFVHPGLYSNKDQFRDQYFGQSEPLKMSLKKRRTLLRKAFSEIASITDGSRSRRLFSFERLQKALKGARAEGAEKRGVRLHNQPLRDGFLLTEIDPTLIVQGPDGDVDWAYLLKTFPSQRYLGTFAPLKARIKGETAEIPLFLIWAETPRGWRIIQFGIIGV